MKEAAALFSPTGLLVRPCKNRGHFAEFRDYVVAVINGEVVTTPSRAVVVGSNGELTLPVMDAF